VRSASLLMPAGIWVLATLAARGGAIPQADVSILTAREPIQRRIARSEEHRYQVVLAPGQLAAISVEQRGIDVGVAVRDDDGALVDDVQDEVRPNGEERVEIVADKSGPYTLTIKPAVSAGAPGDYVIRLAAPRGATEADRRMQQSRSLRTQAHQLEESGRYAEARPLLEQSLTTAESVRGSDDTDVALLVFDLAGIALETQDNPRARALYERAIRTFDQAWGAAHPYPAMARSRLALLDSRAGLRQQAEAEVRDVLPLLEGSVGSEHPWYLQSLVTLANLRQSAGDLQQAEQIDRGVIAAIARTDRTGTILEATVLNNLADILRAKADNTQAEALFQRSLAIGESVLGPDSLFVATALQNLGIIARERKDYPAALASYGRALSIRERLLGPEHPGLAGVLTNLANVYRVMGDDQRALELHRRALGMWEKSVGPYGRETLLVVGNVARTYAGAGDIANALTFQRRADAILETQLDLYVGAGSERQKLAFVRNEAERTDRTISLHLVQAPENTDAAALAALVLLQRKGRVQDAMSDLFTTVRQHVADSADRALMDQLKEASGDLARVAFAGPGTGPQDVRELVARIESRREELEAALSARSAEFRAEMRPVTLEAVQEAMPGDSVLLEYVVFRPFDPEAERNAEAYGPPHYAAYAISKHGTPFGVDLGAVEDIDRLIARMREALRDPASTDVKARARAIDERIMRPVRVAIQGATRLIISPDGGLKLVPFEALVDQHGRYLIERYATTYLTSGRDLLRMQVPRAAPGRPVIVADPLFGEPAATPGQRTLTADAEGRRSATVGTAMSNLYFAPLSGSAFEGRAIKALFPDATLLTGRRATKATLERVKAPAILHIASHGFFLTDDASRGGASVIAENPLLRSGLALAGANLPGNARGDGILTALEAAGLDLWGTNLVTLSACDTGIGEIRDGEGVYGLRRAFMLAGAETLVMSLWPVTDSVARDTMVGYYARLRSGMGRSDALRHAKLAILKRPAMRHPYYWGGFIQSGDWTRLSVVH